MSAEDTDNKPFEPTQKKLDDARKKGNVPKSNDIQGAAAFFGIVLVLSAFGTNSLLDAIEGLRQWLALPFPTSQTFFSNSFQTMFAELIRVLAPFLVLLFGVPIILVILAAIAQRSVTFSPQKLLPKTERISPIAIAKQKFGITGLFEFSKSVVKLVILATVLGVVLAQELENIISLSATGFRQITLYLSDQIVMLLFIICLITLAIGVVDFLFQRFDHMRRLRMSRKELQDEAKEDEGDPYQKQERMQRGRALTQQNDLSKLNTADVIITNPTHYAVALHWSREKGSAPKCVAKGTDEMALRIRHLARSLDIPIHEDPPTARSLFASTQIGQEIPVELYQAVAAAIRFAGDMKRKRATYAS